MFKDFPFIQQLDSIDCGVACLRMIARYYGKNLSSESIAEKSPLSRQGISMSYLGKTAEELGFRSLYVRTSFMRLCQAAPLPAVIFWNQNHFIVIYKISENFVYVADPGFGLTRYSKEEFLKGWANKKQEGLVLLLEPGPEFKKIAQEEPQNKASFSFLVRYLLNFKSYLLAIAVGLLIVSIIEIILPFLTQRVVDTAIANNDINFLYLVLWSEFMLFASMIGIEFIHSWLFIHISSRISLYIISDFLAKLMKLPINFFNTRHTGDLVQRIGDHKNIEKFLTHGLLHTIFAVLTIVILCSVLVYFSMTVFIVFLVGSSLELLWIFYHLERIRIMEHKSFALLAQDQNKIYELITCMQEIKLNNLEQRKRLEWERIQASLFKINLQKLKINQQYECYRFASYLQAVLISFFSALSVIQGQMTVGSMMAISFIVGRLNVPVGQLINFILDGQRAKISLERLAEIHNKKDEELQEAGKLQQLPYRRDIVFENVSFSYGDASRKVLRNLNLIIPEGKTTAIVGVSGSGKTTLLKLLLKFYQPQQGLIFLGNHPLNEYQSSFWRSKAGAVMQDSVIFSGSIAYNIALDEQIDVPAMLRAAQLANISEFIESLPMEYDTRIGHDGIEISQGQKQRLLIARAIYKNPEFLFFDEATNALDTENEKVIVKNMEEFFAGKTVVVVAHRLSTVKNADQIIVLDGGELIEQGSHEQLVKSRGKYYQLVSNQLELEV